MADQEWSPVVREKIICDVRTTNSKHPQVDQVHLYVKVRQGRPGAVKKKVNVGDERCHRQ